MWLNFVLRKHKTRSTLIWKSKEPTALDKNKILSKHTILARALAAKHAKVQTAAAPALAKHLLEAENNVMLSIVEQQLKVWILFACFVLLR